MVPRVRVGSPRRPGELRDSEDVFTWTRRATSPAPGHVDLTFREGVLCEIDGQHIDLIDAIAHLNGFVGRYGHGRFVGLEHLEGDEKILEEREAPAALIPMDALRHLEIATLDTRSMVLKQRLVSIGTGTGPWIGTQSGPPRSRSTGAITPAELVGVAQPG